MNVIFPLKYLELRDEERLMRFFLEAMQGEESVQHWFCDLCVGTLFYVAPKVMSLNSMLTVDWIGVGVYLGQVCWRFRAVDGYTKAHSTLVSDQGRDAWGRSDRCIWCHRLWLRLWFWIWMSGAPVGNRLKVECRRLVSLFPMANRVDEWLCKDNS